MPPSSLEVAMQTMGSVFSDYLEDEKGVSMITKDGLNQLVKEQFPHCEKKEISPGVFRIRIPLDETSSGYSPFDFQELDRIPRGDLGVLFNQFVDFLEMDLFSGNLDIPT
ncbi:UNVERIFIED_CONTAM: hypothetical protein K2H54_022826 [Gekko kuhli]